MTDRFNWYDLENDDIAIPPTLGIAVYMSDPGYLVIRQEGENGEDDKTITINPRDIELFVLSVKKAAGE